MNNINYYNPDIQLQFVNLRIFNNIYPYYESNETNLLTKTANFKTIDKQILVKYFHNRWIMQEVISNENIPLIPINHNSSEWYNTFDIDKNNMNYAGVFVTSNSIVYSNKDPRADVPHYICAKRLDLSDPITGAEFDKYMDENNPNDIRNFIIETLWQGYYNHQAALKFLDDRNKQRQAEYLAGQARLRRIGL